MDLKDAIYSRRSVREFTAEPVNRKRHSRTDRRGHSGAQRSQSSSPTRSALCATRTCWRPFRGKPRRIWCGPRRSGSCRIISSDVLERSKSSTSSLLGAGADPDLHRGGHPVGGRGLRARRGEPDAGGARRGPRHVSGSAFLKAWLGTAEGKALLKLPGAYKPVAPIIVGHPKAAPQPVPRKAKPAIDPPLADLAKINRVGRTMKDPSHSPYFFFLKKKKKKI